MRSRKQNKLLSHIDLLHTSINYLRILLSYYNPASFHSAAILEDIIDYKFIYG